jgi:hypothetical protein
MRGDPIPDRKSDVPDNTSITTAVACADALHLGYDPAKRLDG